MVVAFRDIMRFKISGLQVHAQPGLGKRGTRGRTARQERLIRRADVPGESRIRGGQLSAVRSVDVALPQTRANRQAVPGR